VNILFLGIRRRITLRAVLLLLVKEDVAVKIEEVEGSIQKIESLFLRLKLLR
jgi:hypothetical protein